MALTPTPTDPIKRKYYQDKLTREFYKDFYYDGGYLCARVRKIVQHVVRGIAPATAHRTGNRTGQEGSRSSAASGDGNGNSDDAEPERRQPSLQIYDQAALADLLQISKKTLQNLYSSAPHILPDAIRIPGARGPRWTLSAVQQWLESRPSHTRKPVVIAPKKGVGRPRIASVVKGGAK